MSTPEAQALKHAVENFVNKTADFGHPLVEGEQSAFRGAMNMSPEQAQATAFINGPLADMRKTFRTLLACEDAGQFSDFFNHVREKSNSGEPLYRLLLGETLTGV